MVYYAPLVSVYTIDCLQNVCKRGTARLRAIRLREGFRANFVCIRLRELFVTFTLLDYFDNIDDIVSIWNSLFLEILDLSSISKNREFQMLTISSMLSKYSNIYQVFLKIGNSKCLQYHQCCKNSLIVEIYS